MFGICFGSDLECFIEDLMNSGDGGMVLLAVAAVMGIFFVVIIIKALSPSETKPAPYVLPPTTQPTTPPTTSPILTAKERLAAGEISASEYAEILDLLK